MASSFLLAQALYSVSGKANWTLQVPQELCRIKVAFYLPLGCYPGPTAHTQVAQLKPLSSIFQMTVLGRQLLRFFKVVQAVLAPNMPSGCVPLDQIGEGRWLGTTYLCPCSKSVHKGSHCQAVPMTPRHPSKLLVYGFALSQNIKHYLISCLGKTASPWTCS